MTTSDTRPWPTVATRLTAALNVGDLDGVQSVLAGLPRPLPVGPLSPDVRAIWRTRVADLEDVLHLLETPFTGVAMSAVREHIASGRSGLFKPDGSILTHVSNRVRAQCSHPRERLIALSARFSLDLEPVGIGALTAKATEPGWEAVAEFGNALLKERDARNSLLYPSGVFGGTLDEALAGNLIEVVAGNLVTSLPTKRRFVDTLFRRFSLESPAAGAGEIQAALADSGFDRWLAAGKTGSFAGILDRVLAGCNDACSSLDPHTIQNDSVHRDEYVRHPTEFRNHAGYMYYDIDKFEVVGEVGERRLRLPHSILGSQIPGLRAGITLRHLLEPSRNHVCPAMLTKGVAEFTDLYAGVITVPWLADHAVEFWRVHPEQIALGTQSVSSVSNAATPALQ